MRVCLYLNLILVSTSSFVSESLDEVKEEQKPSPVPSQSNPFGRPGGVILLPDAPALSPHEATGALGLSPSQGYSQMFGGMGSPALTSSAMASFSFSLSLALTHSLTRALS